MNIISIFKSIDGEISGFGQGRVTTFVRLAACNLRCTFCDTEYSFGVGSPIPVSEVFKATMEGNNRNVTITGGEPLLQKKDVTELLRLLVRHSMRISIETNGSLPPIQEFTHHKQVSWVFDYKLPSSGEENKMDVNNFKDLGPNDVVKFLVTEDEIEYTLEVREKLYDAGCRAKIAYSPIEGMSTRDKVVDAILEYGTGDEFVNIQLHKIIWPSCGYGNEK